MKVENERFARRSGLPASIKRSRENIFPTGVNQTGSRARKVSRDILRTDERRINDCYIEDTSMEHEYV